MGEEETVMAEEQTDSADETAYELDLESGDDAEEAMRSALDAVEEQERRRRTIPIDGPESAPRSAAEEEPEQELADDASEEAAAVDPAEAGRASALQERLLRTLADFDNFRKRTEREKEKLKRFAVSDVIKDMLGVIDNLERATAASGSIEELKQGLDMILRQQAEVMKRFGVEPIDAAGKPFDPTLHEAVAREDSSDIGVPTVIRELQKGYTIHDRLLRPSMVHVAMPTAPAKSADEASPDESRDETDHSE